MSENTEQFFLSVTQRIFSNWTALRMAVEHGMGSKEKAVDFCSYVAQVFYMNENPIDTEIAIELEDYMDEYFNTELMDGSAVQVARELLRFFQYCAQNDETTAVAELNKLPPLQSWLVGNKTIVGCLSPQPSTATASDSSEDDDDEWTEIKSRRRK